MKKIITGLIIVIGIFNLTSCDLFNGRTFSNDDHETCDKLMTSLATYLINDDFENAKSLFASRLYEIKSFDEDLNDLIDYFSGEVESIGGLVDTGEYSNWDYEEKHHSLQYSILTSIDKFRFMIDYVEKDTRTKVNIGITNLYVLKLSEDLYPNKNYYGALISQDGIYVGYPHELPEE